MSSILKALEKVEDAQHAKRSGDSPGLGRKREPRPTWLVPAWAIGGAAVATLATFAAMGGFSKPSPPPGPAAKVTAPAPSIAPPAPAAPAPPAPVAQSPVNAAPVRKIEVDEPKVMPDPQPQRVDAAKAVAGKLKPAPNGKQALPAAATKVQAGQGADMIAPAAAVSVTAAPLREAGAEVPRQEIRVTGIAWQGDSRSSFAMVNGRAVRQGDVVDGLKVDRISESSVRFSGANGSITMPLGAGE